jgi:hypothetical protein
MATCEHCGKGFRPRRSDARTCSIRCRVALHRAQARQPPEPEERRCSFCERSASDVAVLFSPRGSAAPGPRICDLCVKQAADLVRQWGSPGFPGSLQNSID